MARQALPPFAGWRVLELSNGIAVSYAAKMFADAGAEVVKVESFQGHSLRRWAAGGPAGALFGYLAAGKGSVLDQDRAEITALLEGADIVLTDLTDGWALDDITAHTAPAAVMVAVTPFGMAGPYVDDRVVANEFILQAICCSTFWDTASRIWSTCWARAPPAPGRRGCDMAVTLCVPPRAGELCAPVRFLVRQDSVVMELTARHRITSVEWDARDAAVAMVVEITDPQTARPVDVRIDVVHAGTGHPAVLGTYLGVVAGEN